MVHDLGRLRARSQDWWTFFCCQSNNAFSRRKAEVVNGLLWVAAKRTFISPGPCPFNRPGLSVRAQRQTVRAPRRVGCSVL